MKYFVSATYTKEGNPFPVFCSSVIDTEEYQREWELFLIEQPWELERIFPERGYLTTENFTIICVSKVE